MHVGALLQPPWQDSNSLFLQVFTLLETLYRAFDEIAKRRRVFKVCMVFGNPK